ncbi:MAG: hypothetical protein AAF968_11210 [Pseudomonadota bacterium]
MIDTLGLTLSARRIARVMSCGLVMLAALAAALALITLVKPGSIGQHLADLSGYPVGPIQAWQTAGLIGVVAIHLAVWITLFATGRRMFRHMADGAPDLAAADAQTLSRWLWAMLVWGIVSQMLVSVLVTFGLPAGQRALQIGIGTPEIFAALTALIAGFMARAFALGAELWRDHQEMV